MIREPKIGTHLISPRTGYSHHGIYVGNGKVIHYSGLADGLESGPVEEADIQTFSARVKIGSATVKKYYARFSIRAIFDRKHSRQTARPPE